ncbi:MAG: acyl-CoA synthetase [Gemmatimonadaceae bacterium]|jgi:malonyl-CoA/methylmalonyl-CoA synthetase|nr:acyl-CoA synthetase [Gemmatimonadaceae bacterium]
MPHLVHSAIAFGDRPAIHDATGTVTYAALHAHAARVATALLCDTDDLHEARVAVLVTPGAAWVAAMWGVWAAGGIAVPLSPQHPPAEWTYALDDADATALVVDAALHDAIAPVAQARALHVTMVETTDAPRTRLPLIGAERRAMMLYTSGTTGRPKGVVHTHGTLAAQIASLIDAWAWTAADHTLLVLPLHHVHGIVNVTCCALAVGAQLTMHARFDASSTWALLQTRRLTCLHAVPTIWARLLAAYDAMSPDEQRQSRAAVAALRLIVSGSAALPVLVLERWRALSGHTLLERYGMTEIGMALSNPLHGMRVPGHVGMPLPGVEVRAVDDDGHPVAPGVPGALEVRGPGVMREYWRRDADTRAAFRDGWFRTGDVGVLEDTAGGKSWRLLGRQSTDILKTGGYKVSALEIEDAVREHEAVAECAVVGLPDEQWGERVAVAVELRAQASLTLDELRAFLKPRIAPYKIPSALVTPESLPRNAMGKVLKPAVRALFGSA